MTRKLRQTRKGTALITVLVCMGFISSIILGWVHVSLNMRRGLRRDQQLVQTHWLLEAGIQQGLQNIQSNKNYEGELITLSQSLSNLDRAAIEIEVLPATDLLKTKRMKVIATIQKNASNAETVTMRSITLELTQ
ncbi:MAG: hypothetical protein ACPIA2_09385 [Mariniblastus sp.]